MKLSLASLLPLAVQAVSPSAAVNDMKQLQSRQLSVLPLLLGSTFDNFPKLKTIEAEVLPPQIRPDAKRLRIRWGPVTAYSAKDSRPGYFSMFPSTDADNPTDTGFAHTIGDVPTDITMLWARVDLKDQDGMPMVSDDKGIYMHHLFFYQLHSDKIRKEFCFGDHQNFVGYLGKGTPNIMLGGGSGDHDAGEMFTTPDEKFNAGYYLPEDASFVVQGEVINTMNYTQYLYPTLEVEYIPGRPQGLKDVSMMMFSVTNCTTKSPTIAFMAPKGESVFNVTSDKFPLPEDGYIINAVGHMHDGGSRIEYRLNGKLMCDSKATYGRNNSTMPMPMRSPRFTRRHGPEISGTETILEMSECTDVIPVKKGDTIELRGFYDLEKHGGRMANGEELGEMGIYVMYFAALPKDEKESSSSLWSWWK